MFVTGYRDEKEWKELKRICADPKKLLKWAMKRGTCFIIKNQK